MCTMQELNDWYNDLLDKWIDDERHGAELGVNAWERQNVGGRTRMTVPEMGDKGFDQEQLYIEIRTYPVNSNGINQHETFNNPAGRSFNIFLEAGELKNMGEQLKNRLAEEFNKSFGDHNWKKLYNVNALIVYRESISNEESLKEKLWSWLDQSFEDILHKINNL